jgi:D-alanyl-D-alanine carboxypeptidase
VLDKPIMIALRYRNDNSFNKALYYYDRCQNNWRSLPTTFDESNGYARALIHFPYTTVAVFEEKREIALAEIDSISAILVDLSNNQTIYSKNPDEVRSIASLTKLMTALVFLDQKLAWQETYTIPDQFSYSQTIGAKLYVRAGDSLTLRDLFYSMLTGSANNAALSLADSTGLTQNEFVAAMNAKAQNLGMKNTTFDDPSGLSVDNQSTAADLVLLSQEAFRFMDILQATTVRQYTFTTINNNSSHTIKNTNELINSSLYLTGGKTGYLDEAGYCLIIKAKQSTDREILSIVLGNPSYYDRFVEAENMVYYGYNN